MADTDAASLTQSEQIDIEALKRYGWTDDEIAGMTPAQRRAEFQEAMETGQSEPPNAETEVPGKPVSTSEDGAVQPQGTREEPIKPAGSADMFNADAPQPTPAQGAVIPLFKGLRARLIYGVVGILFLYALFNVTFQRQEPSPAAAGWESLSQCSVMASFDGKRHLSLDQNHLARIEEPDQPNVDGSWSFDKITGRYTITVNDEPVTYSVVTPGDGDSCMLIKGDLVTADLPRSWFYSRVDLDYQDDRDPPER